MGPVWGICGAGLFSREKVSRPAWAIPYLAAEGSFEKR